MIDRVSAIRLRSTRRRGGFRRAGYVLLETVVASGLLIVGLAVIGAQIQESVTSVRQMNREGRAMFLADMQIAQMSLGLVELDTVDEIQEDDFGERFKDYGWRLIIEETSVPDLFLLTLEVLYYPRENYRDDFDYDVAEVLYTIRTFRVTPRPLDLRTSFGIPDEEFEELSNKLAETGIEGLDAEAFDPAILGKIEIEELMEVLPLLMDAFGMDPTQLLGQLPQEVRDALDSSGVLDQIEGVGNENGNGNRNDNSGSGDEQ